MNSIYIGKSAGLLTLFVTMSLTSVAQRYPGPLSPEESMKKLQIAEGF